MHACFRFIILCYLISFWKPWMISPSWKFINGILGNSKVCVGFLIYMWPNKHAFWSHEVSLEKLRFCLLDIQCGALHVNATQWMYFLHSGALLDLRCGALPVNATHLLSVQFMGALLFLQCGALLCDATHCSLFSARCDALLAMRPIKAPVDNCYLSVYVVHKLAMAMCLNVWFWYYFICYYL